jgi:integrase
MFSCFTGLSYSDVIRLKPQDIVTEDNGTIWVKTFRMKTGSRSNIPLLESALQYIDAPFSDELLFRPLALQTANKGLKKLTIKAEINKKISTHSARHTFATTITLSNDVPLETVSKMLGHSRVRTTQIYARVLDKKVENDMSKLSGKFNF